MAISQLLRQHRHRPIHWQIGVFQPSRSPRMTPLRAWAVSLALRAALHCGFVVLLIGRARSGKTYLLKRTTPGKIVDNSDFWMKSSIRPKFDPTAVPDGIFAIDEPGGFEEQSFSAGVEKLGNRCFVIAAQTRESLERLHIGKALFGRRILVLHLT